MNKSIAPSSVKQYGRRGHHSIDQMSVSEKSVAIKSNALVNKLKADSFAIREQQDVGEEVIVKR